MTTTAVSAGVALAGMILRNGSRVGASVTAPALLRKFLRSVGARSLQTSPWRWAQRGTSRSPGLAGWTV